jgi:hypothetical protein
LAEWDSFVLSFSTSELWMPMYDALRVKMAGLLIEIFFSIWRYVS